MDPENSSAIENTLATTWPRIKAVLDMTQNDGITTSLQHICNGYFGVNNFFVSR